MADAESELEPEPEPELFRVPTEMLLTADVQKDLQKDLLAMSTNSMDLNLSVRRDPTERSMQEARTMTDEERTRNAAFYLDLQATVDIRMLKEQHEVLNDENDRLKQEMVERDNRYKELQNTVDELVAKLAEKDNEIAGVHEEIKKHKFDMKEASARMKLLETKEFELDALKQKNETEGKDQSSLREEVTRKQDRIDELQEDCKTKINEIARLTRACESAEELNTTQGSEIQKLTTRVNELTEELEGVRRKNQALDKEKKAAEDAHKEHAKDLERQIKQAVQEKQGHSNVISEREDSVRKLQKTVEEREGKIKEKEDEIAKLKESREKVTTQLEAQHTEHVAAFEKLTVQNSKEKQELKKKIEQLEGIMKEKMNEYRSAKTQAGEREIELETRIRELVRDVKEAEDKAQLAANNQDHAEKALQAVKEEVAEKEKRHLKELQDRATQIEQLKTDVAMMLESKKDSEQMLTEKIHTAEDAKLAADRKVSIAQAELEAAQEKLAVNEKEKRELMLEKVTVESRVAEKQRRMEEMEADWRKKLFSENERHHQAMQDLNDAKSELQTQLSKMELLKSNTEEQLINANTQIHNHELHIHKLQGDVDKQMRQLEEQQLDEEKRVKEIKTQHEDQIEASHREYRALQLQLDACKKNEEDLRRLKKEHIAEIEELKTRIGNLDRERKNLEERAYFDVQELKDAAAKAKDQFVVKEAKTLEEHNRKVAELQRQIDAHQNDLQNLADRHQEDLKKHEVQCQNEKDDLLREAARAKSAAYNEGGAEAERRAAENIKHLEAAIEALRKEKNQLVLDMAANDKSHKAGMRGMKESLEEVKNAHEKQLREVKDHDRKALEALTDKLEKVSGEVAAERSSKEDLERQLARVKQTAENSKSEYEMQLQSAEMRQFDTEKRCKNQIDDERKRKEKAEEDARDAKHKLEEMCKTVSDRELLLDTKCKRLEVDIKGAHSEAAVAKAKCESLTIQLQERERALTNAGQRIASMISERASSPSPRRQMVFEDYEKRLADTKRNAETLELELERAQMELKKRARENMELEEERKRAVQELHDIENKAYMLDGEQKKVEQDLREVNGDVERLTRELNESKQALRIAQLNHDSKVNDLERDNADLKRALETYKVRAGAEARSLKQQNEQVSAELKKSKELLESARRKNERDAEELRRKTQEVQQSMKSTSSEMSELQQEFISQRSKYDDLRYQLHKSKDELNSAVQRHAQAEHELAMAREEVERVTSENIKLQGKLAESTVRAERQDRDNEVLVSKIQQESSKEVATLRGMLMSREKNGTKAEAEAGALRAQTNAARARLRHADVEHSDMVTRLKQMESTVEAVEKDSYTARRNAAAAETDLVAMRKQMERLKGKSQKLQRGFEDVSNDMRVANGEMVALQTELAGVRKNLFASDMTVRKLAHENELESKRATFAWERARGAVSAQARTGGTPVRALAFNDDSINDESFKGEARMLTSPYRNRHTPRQ